MHCIMQRELRFNWSETAESLEDYRWDYCRVRLDEEEWPVTILIVKKKKNASDVCNNILPLGTDDETYLLR